MRQALVGDVDAMVPLIYSSGPATFNYVFSHRYESQAQDFLRAAFTDGKGQFGANTHIAMESEGRVVAAGTLYSGAQHIEYLRHGVRQMWQFFGPRKFFSSIYYGLRVESVVKPPPGNVAYLAHLGVAPELRGQGLGRQLIHHLCDMARQQGFTKAGLDVAADNPRARVLYLELGFTSVANHRGGLSNRFGTVVDHEYMELLL
ncbi:MAG: GNAT family N-acetyltransferase [Pseudomonadales bacterium]